MWLNEKNYKEFLKGITVIEVSGESCANCISLMPVLNSLMSNIDDAVLHHIEASEDTVEFMEKFSIEAVPTILIMYNDEVFARCRGYQPEEILELWLDAKISELKAKYKL